MARALGLHPGVDCLVFTGSTEVGKHFMAYSAQSNLKQVWLECGGKSANLVFADCTDLDLAVQKAAFGAYWTGFPFGYDLTDNKTVLMWLAWVLAALAMAYLGMAAAFWSSGTAGPAISRKPRRSPLAIRASRWAGKSSASSSA